MDTYDVPRSYNPAADQAVNPLDFYDTPRNVAPVVPAAGQRDSFRSLKNTVSTSSILSTDGSFAVSSSASSSGVSSARNSTCCDYPSSIRSENVYINEPPLEKFSGPSNSSLPEKKRLSVLSEGRLDQMSNGVASMQLYDVPPSSTSSRTQSSMSNYSGGGQSSTSASTRDSTGSSGMNDTATYVNCFEDYDFPRVVTPCQSKQRLNSSSVVTLPPKGQGSSDLISELYDVPRGTAAIPRKNTTSLASLPTTSSSITRRNNHDFNHSRSEMDINRKGVYLNSCPVAFSTETLTAKENISTTSVNLPSKSTDSRKISRDASQEYDVPTLRRRPNGQSTNSLKRASRVSVDTNCSSSGSKESLQDLKVLPINATAAATICEKLQQEILRSIKDVLDFSKPNWRSKENLTEVMPDFRFASIRLNLALKDMIKFCSRSLSNAKKCASKPVIVKMQRLYNDVLNGSQIIQRDVDELDAYFWSPERLSVHPSEAANPKDAIEQLLLCATSLSHDITEISNYIRMNVSTLFPETCPSNSETSSVTASDKGPVEDYDYVCLVPADADESDSSKDVTPTTSTPPRQPVFTDPKDRDLIEFYTEQVVDITPLLTRGITEFISSLQRNEPPKMFNVHLKYVVLLSYKMLFSGDTIHRNMVTMPLKSEIESKSNDLHKAILELHEASRTATRKFPSIQPVQNIVEKVCNIIKAASQLKSMLIQTLELETEETL